MIQSGGKAVVRAVNKKSIHGDIVWAGASEGAMINSSEFQKYVLVKVVDLCLKKNILIKYLSLSVAEE